ncbi:O-antigen ligase family protein [Sphingomonas sp. HDW15A]|uniref:O-antigen ligase family protein n=1 Tax=Sphingomonas sp. HDW15A TaxID=2714942 RepID=UPI00140BF021|nr:O-antigen ligase family protein [Sphingomonas sp. HDW15A]QIK95847.1 O-antigen ligase family protein [Sphingomonas sp. HDW15A]
MAVVSALAVVAFLDTNSALLTGQQTSISTRQEMWANTWHLAGQFLPLGSGLGSFPMVYPLSEDLGRVDWTFVNHAHNDYLELLLELGIPGAVLLVAFLIWWTWQTVQIWISREVSLLARAATIASGALLLHSVVDFPLRTAALAGLFGWCLAVMVTRPRTLRAPVKSEARHLTFEDLK